MIEPCTQAGGFLFQSVGSRSHWEFLLSSWAVTGALTIPVRVLFPLRNAARCADLGFPWQAQTTARSSWWSLKEKMSAPPPAVSTKVFWFLTGPHKVDWNVDTSEKRRPNARSLVTVERGQPGESRVWALYLVWMCLNLAVTTTQSASLSVKQQCQSLSAREEAYLVIQHTVNAQ